MAPAGVAAWVANAASNLGAAQFLQHQLIELVDDVGGHLGRAEQAVGVRRDDRRITELRGGRHIGQGRRALWRADRERDELSGLDVLQEERRVREHDVGMTAEQVGDRRRCAAIMDRHDLDAGFAHQQFAGEMRDRAGAGGGEIELARIGLGVAQQFGERLDAERRLDHQHRGHRADPGDRRQVLERIEGRRRAQVRRHQHRRHRGHQQRIAIGRRVDDRLCADDPTGAGLVLDHDRVADRPGQAG